jgi:hypothetical protein
MHRRSTRLRRLGIGGLALAGLLGLWLVWPSPREVVEVVVASTPAGDGSATGSTDADHNAALLPQLTVRLDLPASVLRGRHERLGLSIASDPASTAFTLAAEVVSADLRVTPPGESGQAYRPGAAFAWTVVAGQAPDASATIVLRARRSAADGSAQSERLLLARDLRLPVRTVAGLSAPVAAWAAASLALAGVLLLFVGRRSRKG